MLHFKVDLYISDNIEKYNFIQDQIQRQLPLNTNQDRNMGL
jgi:hypothetical protein